MKKIENLGKSLSKSQQRLVSGGVVSPCHCTCSGGTGGSWQYNYEPYGSTISKDIADYCSTGAATCGGCTNIYK